MLKSPTSRRKSSRDEINLPLVPVIDTMVTLIGFLLFTMSFFSVVSIESPFPQASARDVEEKLKEKPLQLTVTVRDQEVEIWSPFERFPAKKIPHISTGLPDTKVLHESLVAIKQQFPHETKIVVVPNASTNYDILISVMDSMRMMEPSDPPLYRKNVATGNDEAIKALFPEVIFGNLLGGGDS